MLTAGGELCLGLDEAFEVGNGQAGREIEGDDVLVIGFVGCVDVDGDARPVASTCQSRSRYVKECGIKEASSQESGCVHLVNRVGARLSLCTSFSIRWRLPGGM